MKKTVFVVSLGLLLFSCGNKELESDAEKLANLQCEIKELSQNQELDEFDASRAEELGNEVAELSESLAGKYAEPDDMVAFQKALKEKMENCMY